MEQKELGYLYLPSHLIMEEAWTTLLRNSKVSFLKVQTASESGIKVYLDFELMGKVLFLLEQEYSKRESTSKKSPTSSTPEE